MRGKVTPLGIPRGSSRYPWRLDDEELVYPAYETMMEAGIRNVCIHKGLLPSGYKQKLTKEQIPYAKVDDLGKAAQDWPNLNFIIYHSAIEKDIPRPDDAAEFRKTGRIAWVTDLSEIPEKYGVKNVYAELGGVFATTAVAHPELCAGVLGTLIRGLGEDTSAGGPIRSGGGRLNGRSRRCGGSRSPNICGRSTGSSRWDRLTARSKTRSSRRTQQGYTILTRVIGDPFLPPDSACRIGMARSVRRFPVDDHPLGGNASSSACPMMEWNFWPYKGSMILL